MKGASELRNTLQRIDRKGYKAYKEILGSYRLGDFVLRVDHVQGDPFASPTRVSVLIDLPETQIPSWLYGNPVRAVALRDFLNRTFAHAIDRIGPRKRGSGKSGLIEVLRPGQKVLERTSVVIKDTTLEVRFFIGLPASGRTILAKEAQKMLLQDIPKIVDSALFWKNIPQDRAIEHVTTVEDAEYLRMKLSEHGFIAFVSDGAVLPRASGVEDTPMKGPQVVPFRSPPEMRHTFELPNRGPVTGMAITEGVVLITGGGYHGKSTLLEALQAGVYNHIPGDGREFVITRADAVKIRAEDGRAVRAVDISGFIQGLPTGIDTKAFSTEDASGSTSQAANIMEALEMGSRLLLVDEDTSATNFMLRDRRMQALIPKEFEPITAFIDRVRELYERMGVSTLLVAGGAGDYLEVAHRVIAMINYQPHDYTQRAKETVMAYPSGRLTEPLEPIKPPVERIPLGGSIDPSRGRKPVKVSAKDTQVLSFGRHKIDLHAVEQIAEKAQTEAIGFAMYYCRRYMDGKATVKEVVQRVMEDLKNNGLDILSPHVRGDLAIFRPFELAATLNRYRPLKVRQLR
ncbi:MAG: ATPase [Nitrospirae bacterium]|nr:MAG: ATPase [Nitrospirota bacterium]